MNTNFGATTITNFDVTNNGVVTHMTDVTVTWNSHVHLPFQSPLLVLVLALVLVGVAWRASFIARSANAIDLARELRRP